MANSYQEQDKALTELGVNAVSPTILDAHKAVFSLRAMLCSARGLGSPCVSAGLLLQNSILEKRSRSCKKPQMTVLLDNGSKFPVCAGNPIWESARLNGIPVG